MGDTEHEQWQKTSRPAQTVKKAAPKRLLERLKKVAEGETTTSKVAPYKYEIEDAIFTGVINVMLGEDTADNVLANLDVLSGYEG